MRVALIFCSFITLTFAVEPSALACEGCHGVVTELHERLSKPSNKPAHERVSRLLDTICKTENLVKYVYSPPKMVKACNELLGAHRKEIQEHLSSEFEKKLDVKLSDLEFKICFIISRSCKGIKEPAKQTVAADLVLDGSGEREILFPADAEKLTAARRAEQAGKIPVSVEDGQEQQIRDEL